MAHHPDGQMPDLLAARRSPGHRRRADPAAQDPGSGLPRHRPRTAARADRQPEATGRRTGDARDDAARLRARHPARLVEAGRAQAESDWKPIERTIRSADPYCRGVLLLGFDAPVAKLANAFAAAAAQPICKGFAVGRSIFAKPAEDWLSGHIDDAAAVRRMASAYRRLLEAWRTSRGATGDRNGAAL